MITYDGLERFVALGGMDELSALRAEVEALRTELSTAHDRLEQRSESVAYYRDMAVERGKLLEAAEAELSNTRQERDIALATCEAHRLAAAGKWHDRLAIVRAEQRRVLDAANVVTEELRVRNEPGVAADFLNVALHQLAAAVDALSTPPPTETP